jgi:hypothetical protein
VGDIRRPPFRRPHPWLPRSRGAGLAHTWPSVSWCVQRHSGAGTAGTSVARAHLRRPRTLPVSTRALPSPSSAGAPQPAELDGRCMSAGGGSDAGLLARVGGVVRRLLGPRRQRRRRVGQLQAARGAVRRAVQGGVCACEWRG